MGLIHSFRNERFHIIKSTDSLTGKTSSNQSANEYKESMGSRLDVCLLHLDNKLPRYVKLMDLSENVDHDIIGNGGNDGRRRRDRESILEKGEGNFGVVAETEESLVEEMRGKREAVELKRRFHGVEWVVMVEQDLGKQLSVV